jgi:hypothetical protein
VNSNVPLHDPGLALADGGGGLGWMLDRTRLCREVSALRFQETVRRLEVSIDRRSREPAGDLGTRPALRRR